MNPEERLACSIIVQAIEDLRDLRHRNITICRDEPMRAGYSIKDIENFFKSRWCSELLEMIHTKLTGVDIFSKVEHLLLKERVT